MLEAIEADELALGRHVDFLGVLGVEGLEAVVEFAFGDIRHGHELERRAGDGEGVVGGAGAASAAADEGDLDGAGLGGVDEGDLNSGEGGDGGDAARGFEKGAAGAGGEVR